MNSNFSRGAAPIATQALFLILAILSTSQSVSAEKIYTSRDESGRLTFSDKPMHGNGRIIGVQQIEVAKGPCFSVTREGPKDDVRMHGVNDCHGPVEFEFTLTEAENVSSNRPRTFRAVIPPRRSELLVRLWQADRRKGFKYTTTHSHVIGDPRATHLPSRPYLLPTPKGQKFRISQAFKGTATHTHPQSEFAVDIPMPEGTGVFAARSGVLMDVANDFFTGGPESKFNEKANFVRILHDDGTMALYAHLELESIRYPVGTRVERGQLIAESGNTGHSSGPHLHFAVQRNCGMELRSIAFEFEGVNGFAFIPEAGMEITR